MNALKKLFNFTNARVGDTMVFSKSECREIATTFISHQQAVMFTEVASKAIKAERDDLQEYLNKLLTEPDLIYQEHIKLHGEKND